MGEGRLRLRASIRRFWRTAPTANILGAMARRSILYSAFLAVFCAGLLAATAAGAMKVTGKVTTHVRKRPPSQEEARPPNGFEVEGSNGWSISVSTYLGGSGQRGTVSVRASRGRESASYTAAAKVTPKAVHADLGRFGRIDMRLHLSGAEATAHDKCLHYTEAYEAGTYEGSFEFRGEGGYTTARATAAPALPAPPFLGFNICNRQQSSGESFGPGEPGARLQGISYAAGRVLKFEINKNRPRGKTLYTASLAERIGGVKIYRQLTGVAPASAFHYDRKVRTATLSPPAPFSGSASLRRDKNMVSPLWNGNLMLAFPGHTVPTAGPAVHVSLEHARLDYGNNSGSFTFGARG
jgi:hypothetical protein